MKRFPTLLMLVAPFIFLTAAKERKEVLVKREEPKEELVTKKKALEKRAPSRRIKIVSHTTSIAVSVILSLIFMYFIIGELTEGFFGNKHVNTFVCFILFSVVGFYFYLYMESFLAKKMPSAIGKFFSGLISFLLSGCVETIFVSLYPFELPKNLEQLEADLMFGFIMSLNSSLFSWWIYTGINWVAG